MVDLQSRFSQQGRLLWHVIWRVPWSMKKTGVMENDCCLKWDVESYYASCEKINVLVRTWRNRLMVAKEAKRVDVLCLSVFLSHKILKEAEQHKELLKTMKRGTDTMDGWFDPSSSWVAVLDGRNDLSCPADLYLEGTVVSKFFANQCCYERKSSIFQCYYTWISTGWEKFRDEQIFGKCYISTHGDLRWKAIQVVCCKIWDFGFKSLQIFEEVGHHPAVKQRQWNRMMWLSLLRALKTRSLRYWRLEMPVSLEGVVWDGESLPEGKVWLEATYQFQIQQSCILH